MLLVSKSDPNLRSKSQFYQISKFYSKPQIYTFKPLNSTVITINRVIYQVISTLQALVKVRKPGIQNVPHKWPDLLRHDGTLYSKAENQQGIMGVS